MSFVGSLAISSIYTLAPIGPDPGYPLASSGVETIATFEKSELCTDEPSEQEIIRQRIAEATDAELTLVLVAYSDGSDFNDPPRDPTIQCPNFPLPDGLPSHLRLATSRGLHIYHLAKEAGISGFDRDFAIVWTPAELETLHGDFVFIVPRRSSGKAAQDRRVDLVVIPPPPHNDDPVLQPTVKLAPAAPAIDPLPTHCPTCSQHPSPRNRTAKVTALALLATGVAGAGVATGFFAVATDQFQAGRETLGPEAGSLREDGRRYALGGGLALGIGLGAAVAGIAVLTIVLRRSGQRAQERSFALRPNTTHTW